MIVKFILKIDDPAAPDLGKGMGKGVIATQLMRDDSIDRSEFLSDPDPSILCSLMDLANNLRDKFINADFLVMEDLVDGVEYDVELPNGDRSTMVYKEEGGQMFISTSLIGKMKVPIDHAISWSHVRRT